MYGPFEPYEIETCILGSGSVWVVYWTYSGRPTCSDSVRKWYFDPW